MKTTARFTLILSLSLISAGILQAEDLRKVINLSGTWKFSIGDDMRWASPSWDDSGWDQLNAPEQWENQGYDDYNGFAWYRKKFKLAEVPANTRLILQLGNIDDADEVYLNGKLIGKSGKFPPYFVTAYDNDRKYAIPSGLLLANGENTIAVRVYDTFLDGGFRSGPLAISQDVDNDYLSINLSGRWRFHTGNDKDWASPEFNDEKWRTIQVPAAWENQGYVNYDGYAWYRLSFKVPEGVAKGDYYLSLGKVDDIDDVYLNGKHIGTVYDLKKDGDYRRSGWEYNARRLYKIPAGLLRGNSINTVAVRVYDQQLRGGIFEGPIGIMSAENYKRFRNKYYASQPFWDSVFDIFNMY